LSTRYGIEPARPTTLEIFPEQKDFAVRTFGEPGNPGYLGVCFGRVITANSPASQAGNPSNWEAVLWHEFCHVITLQMTRHKMPRWLSEGISVYEELQADPAWGQTMMPRYREMMLGDDLKPVAELSAAFLSPKTGLHLQFAYYQSALVVEYLVTRYGFDALKGILQDLGQGVAINAAIAKRTAPMKEVESGFKAFARARAEAMGPGLDWFKPARFVRTSLVPGRARPIAEPAPELQATNAASSGRNYWVLMEQAANHINERRWAEAKAPLKTLIEHYPDQNGANNAYALLAAAHRGLNEATAERDALEKWAMLEGDALDATLRLMDLAAGTGDWKAVALNAERTLAVNPLLPQPYRMLARAAEELDDPPRAINAWEKLALLDPPDPAEVHYRLARLLRSSDGSRARRHVLLALEDAPRFREAHQLLLELGPSAGAAPEP
jgi:tetratricopeptide (TPR) repeat protein